MSQLSQDEYCNTETKYGGQRDQRKDVYTPPC